MSWLLFHFLLLIQKTDASLLVLFLIPFRCPVHPAVLAAEPL